MNQPEIDPVKYGVLWQKVQDYKRRFDEMSAKIDKLVALAIQEQQALITSLTDRIAALEAR